MTRWTLHHADCLDAMRTMEAESVDAIVTDPPYGLSFMGKGWDHGVPGVEFWREALRVAKPGSHLVAFGGTRTFHRLTCAIEDAGWEIRDCLSWLYGTGFPKSLNVGGGRGTALKPAWEPIILARKPLGGTVAANVLAHGTGAINVDACRIGTETVGWSGSRGGSDDATQSMGRNYRLGAGDPRPVTGRWPANVALDEDAAEMLDAQTGERRSSGIFAPKDNGSDWKKNHVTSFGGNGTPATMYGDSGGASRFFYTAKASRQERGEGNTHPTVKPIALMRWLVRLVCPPGGLVLDPFNGSGSTGVAALAEGMRYVGCEREAEYVEISRRRLELSHAQMELL